MKTLISKPNFFVLSNEVEKEPIPSGPYATSETTLCRASVVSSINNAEGVKQFVIEGSKKPLTNIEIKSIVVIRNENQRAEYSVRYSSTIYFN